MITLDCLQRTPRLRTHLNLNLLAKLQRPYKSSDHLIPQNTIYIPKNDQILQKSSKIWCGKNNLPKLYSPMQLTLITSISKCT